MKKLFSNLNPVSQIRTVLTLLFIAVFLGAVFVFVGAVDKSCNTGPQKNQCDYNSKVCKSRGYMWTVYGYSGGAGNPSCCGDDNQENFLNCQISTEGGVSCGSNTQACCDINSKCVYNGACYARSGFNGVNTNDASTDLEFCLGYYDHDLPSRWFDQDTDQSVMGSSLCETQGNSWFSSAASCEIGAGPGGICDDADGGAFCCGDDANEKYVSKDCNGRKTALCCPTSKPFVKNGVCVNSCSAATKKSAIKF